jgi:hypothetical protein
VIASIFGHATSITVHIIIVISCDSAKGIGFSCIAGTHGTSHDKPPSLSLVQLRRLTVQLPNKPIFVLFSSIRYLNWLNGYNILH